MANEIPGIISLTRASTALPYEEQENDADRFAMPLSAFLDSLQNQFSGPDFYTFKKKQEAFNEKIKAIEALKGKLIAYSETLKGQLTLSNESIDAEANQDYAKLQEEINQLTQQALVLKASSFLLQLTPFLSKIEKKLESTKSQKSTIQELSAAQRNLRRFIDNSIFLSSQELDETIATANSDIRSMYDEYSAHREEQKIYRNTLQTIVMTPQKLALPIAEPTSSSAPKSQWQLLLDKVRTEIGTLHRENQLRSEISKEDQEKISHLESRKNALKEVVAKEAELFLIREKVQTTLKVIQEKYPKDYATLLEAASQFKEVEKGKDSYALQVALANKLKEPYLPDSTSTLAPKKLSFEDSPAPKVSSSIATPSAPPAQNAPPPPPAAPPATPSLRRIATLTQLLPKVIASGAIKPVKTSAEIAELERLTKEKEEISANNKEREKVLFTETLSLLFIETTLDLLADKLSSDLKTDLTLIKNFDTSSIPVKKGNFIAVNKTSSPKVNPPRKTTATPTTPNKGETATSSTSLQSTKILQGPEIKKRLDQADHLLTEIHKAENALKRLTTQERKIEDTSFQRNQTATNKAKEKQEPLRVELRKIVEELKAFFGMLETTALITARDTRKEAQKAKANLEKYLELREKRKALQASSDNQQSILSTLEIEKARITKEYTALQEKYVRYELAQTPEISAEEIEQLQQLYEADLSKKAEVEVEVEESEKTMQASKGEIDTIDQAIQYHKMSLIKTELDDFLHPDSLRASAFHKIGQAIKIITTPEAASENQEAEFSSTTDKATVKASIEKNKAIDNYFPLILKNTEEAIAQLEAMLKTLQHTFKQYSEIHSYFKGRPLDTIDLKYATTRADGIMSKIKELTIYRGSTLVNSINFNKFEKVFTEIKGLLEKSQDLLKEKMGDSAPSKDWTALEEEKKALTAKYTALKHQQEEAKEEAARQIRKVEQREQDLKEAINKNQQIALAKTWAQPIIESGSFDKDMQKVDLRKGKISLELEEIEVKLHTAKTDLEKTSQDINQIEKEYKSFLASLSGSATTEGSGIGVQGKLETIKAEHKNKAFLALLDFAKTRAQFRPIKEAEDFIESFQEEGVLLEKDVFLTDSSLPAQHHAKMAGAISQFLAGQGQIISLYYEEANLTPPSTLPPVVKPVRPLDKALINQLGAIFITLLQSPESIEIYLKTQSYLAACIHAQKLQNGEITLEEEKKLVTQAAQTKTSASRSSAPLGEEAPPKDLQAELQRRFKN